MIPPHADKAGDAAPAPERVQEEILHQSELSRISRRSLPGGDALICKTFLGANAEQRLLHERRIMERLAAVQGVPRLFAGSFPPAVLAYRDTGATPLAPLVPALRAQIPALVELALKLARIVAAVHREGVVHRNIGTPNILVCGGLDPVLIDFGLATTFGQERPGFVHHREIAGLLPYLAPEQTGRTGRGVDQRADLYALGATLYQIATGRLPFEEKDPLQLIHEILAQLPAAPVRRNKALPGLFSDIIMRLLEKEPDRRYQSAQGVAHDLSRLAAALGRGEAADFRLGERDFALRLPPPSRLVGRQAELAALKGAFERAAAGEGCCVLVCGGPGVGKTALLNELHPLVTARGGVVAAGKFDQFRRDLASDGVYQVFRALGRLLLAEPEEELQAIKRKMLQELGSNAGLVAALHPECALLLGVAPEPVGGDPLNSKERLIQASLDHLRSMMTPQRPLVMLLDDLQWAAPLPLGFFELLAGHPLPGLLLIGSFREEELETAAELRAMLSRFEQKARDPFLLRLGNLAPEELTLFLQEMLRLEPEEAEPLGRAVAARTGGNPYHTVELINALRSDGTLVAGETGWQWEAQAIHRCLGQGDVVELLEGRMKRLPARAQELLDSMACFGGEVDTHLLGLAGGLSGEALQEGLAPCIEEGLLACSGNTLRFCHDRVQQAACGRLRPEQKRLLHLSLARRLARQPGLELLAAQQFLPALEALEERAEKDLAISLFRSAAAGMRTVNFEETGRFAAAALKLLGGEQRAADLPLRIALETEQHAALYSLGRLDEADRVYRSIERLSKDPIDRVQAACLQVCSMTNRARPMEAVSLGLDLLRELGFAVPEGEELESAAARGLALLDRWVESLDLARDLQRPEPGDLKAVTAARLINRIIPPAFFSNQVMTSWWLVLESLRLWMAHGPCAALVGPMSHLGFAAISLRQRYRSGHRAVRHVLAVGEARGWEPETSQARFLYAMSVAPWFDPLQEGVLHALRAHEGLMQGGDLQNACFTYYASIPQLFDCAPTLEGYASRIERAVALADRTGNAQVRTILTAYRELVRQLRDESPPDSPGNGDREEGKTGDATSLSISNVSRALYAALCQEPADLAQHAAEMQQYTAYMQGTYGGLQARMLLLLDLAHQARGRAPEERGELLAGFDEGLRFLAERAADAPENFLHIVKWLKAEREWAAGEFRGSVASFDGALDLAASLQRPWHRALITERAALFHLECGLRQTGRLLMEQARSLYEDWGARAKVRQLDAEHPFLRACRPAAGSGDPASSISIDAVELLAILRASQTLSSETSLERLKTLVVELLATMTGATAVSLVVRQDQEEEWRLLPSSLSGESLEPIPVGEAAALGLLPISVFHYAERTRKPLMVEDATRDDRFRHDRYLAGYQCCSLLALPVLNQGAPRAVLLLENKLCRGAFTSALLDAVALIAGQLAVSLENALLYEKLEDRVRERTRELQEAQHELVRAARSAGMAEIATNVLHNVGNVLNSVNVSADLVMERLKGSRSAGLSKSVQLMNQHSADLGRFLTQDEKGKLLPGYLEKLAATLDAEQQELVEELTRLTKSVNHIKEIVSTQQCYAGNAQILEAVQIQELVDDAVRMNAAALTRHEVTVVRNYAELPVLTLDKARVLQILVNLVNNAKQAMDRTAQGPRTLELRVELADRRRLRISVCDEGEGIAQEDLSRIFNHGFTTRKGGHGFGLHSCALAAREMGGTLTARSAGTGKGATFILEIPVLPEKGASGAGAAA